MPNIIRKVQNQIVVTLTLPPKIDFRQFLVGMPVRAGYHVGFHIARRYLVKWAQIELKLTDEEASRLSWTMKYRWRDQHRAKRGLS